MTDSEDMTDAETPMSEPRWLSRSIVDAIHADQIQRHGGLPGVNADALIGLALSRPRDRWDSADTAYVDLAELAASYGYALAKNRGYRDGNQRVAFLAMYVFLGLNGTRLVAPPEEVVPLMHNAPSRKLSQLAAWVRDHIEPWDAAPPSADDAAPSRDGSEPPLPSHESASPGN